ncbi:AraC family transcriptional regulator [Sphingobacterium sp. DR205]|uniref:helix-turn-helix domain-containing protein n=1 Tax=Sphingobacterium sp. DR205 TaxID=2713573 RepID=UPI0013E417FB|nr:AraC family transcriptional regulator [Sphingobacterium sp. DR205]QIH34470.1 helix-turn-helix transcriptional regulator [Sphingobacterium sp. DR205]
MTVVVIGGIFINLKVNLPNHMKTKACYYTIILLTLFSQCLFAQKNEKYSDYYLIRRNYEGLTENDASAKPFIEKYIAKAKREKDYQRLVRGYLDAILYSPAPNDKLKFADSTIWASKMTGNNEQISSAYLEKGVVYYFQFKKYKLALDEYLKAYKYSRNGKDKFYQNRLSYLIGVVKSYCGYYEDAIEYFKTTSAFFQTETKKEMHPNILYANVRGYYNSVHQMAVCYRNLGNYEAADSLICIGLSGTSGSKEYMQEYSYFLKEKGIDEYRKKRYQSAISSLRSSIGSIDAVNDFAGVTVCYSYLGKSYLALGNNAVAVAYFQKVDSVFQKHTFILPELRDNYELLIDHYKKENNIRKELYYSEQLLKADNVLNKDFTYLSSKIHKEYDTKTLTDEVVRLNNEKSRGFWMSIIIAVLALFTLILIIIIHKRKEKKIQKSYKALEHIILNNNLFLSSQKPLKEKEQDTQDIEENIKHEILIKLEKFEKDIEFIEVGLTISKLATKFGTNSNYLSQIINEYKGKNFNSYLKHLRIGYITHKLYTDRKFLTYKVETLAEKCGIASRSNFSKIFQEINGIRPIDFIKNRQKDLNMLTNEDIEPSDQAD